jgi:PBP1b-binding outer membrane lipoprotein LpoB
MKKIYIAVSLLALILVGCKDDSAPKVDDVNHIVVDGKTYSARDFYRTFCQKPNSPSDETCIKVEKKTLSDQTRIVPLTPQ